MKRETSFSYLRFSTTKAPCFQQYSVTPFLFRTAVYKNPHSHRDVDRRSADTLLVPDGECLEFQRGHPGLWQCRYSHESLHHDKQKPPG